MSVIKGGPDEDDREFGLAWYQAFLLGAVPPPPVLYPTSANPSFTPMGTDINRLWMSSTSPPHSSPFPQLTSPPFNPFYAPQLSPQADTSKRTSCCAVSEAKEDVREVINDSKKDLDRIIETLGVKEVDDSNPMAHASYDMQLCALHDCAYYGQVFSGHWFSCLGCKMVTVSHCILSFTITLLIHHVVSLLQVVSTTVLRWCGMEEAPVVRMEMPEVPN